MLLVFAGLLPLALALILRHVRGRAAREICAVAFTCVTSCLVGAALLWTGDQRLEGFRLTEDFVFALRLDGAGKIYLGLAAVLWPFATLYGVEYMRHESRQGQFFSWYLASYSAVIFLAAAGNLFTLYIFYEFLTLCTVPLVWHKKDAESNRAALVYMLYLIGGAALGFIAMVGLGAYYHTGSFVQGPKTAVENALPAQWLALIGFVGFGVKAAVLPLCRWLPTASVAPTPVTALLHAVAVVNAGVYAVMRLLYQAAPYVAGSWAQTAIMAMCAATIVYGAVMAVREQQVKKRLAWSTVSNLSYMLFGLSLLTESGLTAGLSHMVFHGLMKIILFFCAGAVLTQSGRTRVIRMQGMGRKMPLTFGCFTLAGLSLVGVPPLPGFVSKYALVTAAFEKGGAMPILGGVTLLVAAVLTTIYIFTVVYPAFFMAYRPMEGERTPRDPGPCMKITLLALCLLLALAGIFAGRIMTVLTDAAKGVMIL